MYKLSGFRFLLRAAQNCIPHVLIKILRDTENDQKMLKAKFSTGRSEKFFRSIAQLASYRFLSGPHFVLPTKYSGILFC